MDRNDSKLLLCFALASLREPIEREELCRTLSGDGVGYFDLLDGVGELVRDGFAEETDSGCAATERGQALAASSQWKIPATEREKAVGSLLRLTAARRLARENPVFISANGDGTFTVTCRVCDGGAELMSLSLTAFDKEQANTLAARFSSDPAAVYTGVIALLTAGAKENCSNTTID